MAEVEELIPEVEKKLESSQKKWSSIVISIKQRLFEEVQKMPEVEAESISHIQILTDEITSYSLRIAKHMSKYRKMEKEKFEFYCMGYKIKTNAAEKNKLIGADLSSHQHHINIFEIHVEFLRETKKNLDNIRWAVKNKIELYNQLGIN